jgi:hypothetical protein
VREYLRRRSNNYYITKGDIAAFFRVSERKGAEILREMRRRGWVKRLKGSSWKHGHHEITMGGNALVAASAVPPINRAKAERLLADFLKRVVEVNARSELTHYVHEVQIFGSYLSKKAKDLGDLDLPLICACVRFRVAIRKSTSKSERINRSGSSVRGLSVGAMANSRSQYIE